MVPKILPIIGAAARRLVTRNLQGALCAIVTATTRLSPRRSRASSAWRTSSPPSRGVRRQFTGKVSGTPCFREGKVTRVEQWLAAQGRRWDDFSESRFYSDSHNDLPLLERVTHPVAVRPDPALERTARARGWDVIALD
jgi:phosphoserine phosphatase